MFVTGDIAGMRTHGGGAVALARDLGDPALHAEAAILAGHAAVFTLEADEAADMLDEARQAASSSGHREESAAFLFGASASLSMAHSADPRFPVSSRLSHQALATARGQLDEETFRRSWDAGRAATTADVAELARQLRTHALR
jgi:hypothetical protein